MAQPSGVCRLVSTLATGPAAAGALIWRAGREIQVTLVAQVRLRFVHEGIAKPMDPEPIVEADRPDGEGGLQSLVAPSEAVPYRPGVDVWMRGHACAPGGVPTTACSVRLALFRDGVASFDKLIEVYGDRNQATGATLAFARMPLVYERAYGGPGFDANPVGTGHAPGSRPPNLVDPRQRTAPACFGPVSAQWRPRRGLLSSERRRELERAVPLIGPGFDWSYFHASPEDQRLGQLYGDEWLVLDGLSSDQPRVQTQLPQVEAVGAVSVGERRSCARVAMVADSLVIDADAATLTLTFRGIFGVRDFAELGWIRAGVAVGRIGDSHDWSAFEARLNRAPSLLEAAPDAVLRELDVSEGRFASRRPSGVPEVEVAGRSASQGNDAEPSLEVTMKSRVVRAPRRRPSAVKPMDDSMTDIDVAAWWPEADADEQNPLERTLPSGDRRRLLGSFAIAAPEPADGPSDETISMEMSGPLEFDPPDPLD